MYYAIAKEIGNGSYSRVALVDASLGTLSADQSYAWYRERIAREAYRERHLQELVDR